MMWVMSAAGLDQVEDRRRVPSVNWRIIKEGTKSWRFRTAPKAPLAGVFGDRDDQQASASLEGGC